MVELGKTLGPDGIPVEFYKQYAEDLATRLHMMPKVIENEGASLFYGRSGYSGDPQAREGPLLIFIVMPYIPVKCR